jgi:hypothetical protein
MLAYEVFITDNKEAFIARLQEIANILGLSADWLMGVMYLESRLNPRARNPKTNATGLIQFMPNTAISLGTTVDQLAEMTNLRQLDYVLQYYLPYKGRINSFADCYFVTFFPAAIGKPDDWVLQASSLSAGKIAAQNAIYDLNRDGMITVGEVKAKLPDLEAVKKKQLTN